MTCHPRTPQRRRSGLRSEPAGANSGPAPGAAGVWQAPGWEAPAPRTLCSGSLRDRGSGIARASEAGHSPSPDPDPADPATATYRGGCDHRGRGFDSGPDRPCFPSDPANALVGRRPCLCLPHGPCLAGRFSGRRLGRAPDPSSPHAHRAPPPRCHERSRWTPCPPAHMRTPPHSPTASRIARDRGKPTTRARTGHLMRMPQEQGAAPAATPSCRRYALEVVLVPRSLVPTPKSHLVTPVPPAPS
jgi:hypothetical protein